MIKLDKFSQVLRTDNTLNHKNSIQQLSKTCATLDFFYQNDTSRKRCQHFKWWNAQNIIGIVGDTFCRDSISYKSPLILTLLYLRLTICDLYRVHKGNQYGSFSNLKCPFLFYVIKTDLAASFSQLNYVYLTAMFKEANIAFEVNIGEGSTKWPKVA